MVREGEIALIEALSNWEARGAERSQASERDSVRLGAGLFSNEPSLDTSQLVSRGQVGAGGGSIRGEKA
jgi:hypothetical protein